MMDGKELLPTDLEESARLRELYSLEILDTPAEHRFDQYTQLVADVLEVPTVLISLVDEQRQWFKSAVGLNVEQTSREVSFCAQALPVDFLEIQDAHGDERFRDNPLVTGEPYIRFYAGAVLHGPTGQPLGTLCVIDNQPRRLSASQKRQLVAFAGLVEQEIALHHRFRSLQDDLQRAAFYDPVTGLPERSLLEAHLTRSIDEARAASEPVVVAKIRISNFEVLASLEGKQGSDAIVQALSKRLKAHLRPTDQIGRWGNERFLIVMPGLREPNDRRRIHALAEQLAQPVEIGNARRPIHLAVGVSRFPGDAQTATDLIDYARIAACDSSEDISIGFYARETYSNLSRYHNLSHRLGEVLRSQGMRQVYQPILDCASGHVVGVEALARWQDSTHGTVSPAEFIPMIESDTSMRRALTRWSLRTACRQLCEWRQKHGWQLRISVNIPGGELYRNDFTDVVRITLRQYDIRPEQLVLELTEENLITDLAVAVATMSEIRADGVRFAVDDFGTGYSSLNYLKQLPLDMIKIDRSFICNIDSDQTTRELASGIFDIARTLKLRIVAEGIETPEQHAVLQDLGCDYVQGFLFSQPVAADAVSCQRYKIP